MLVGGKERARLDSEGEEKGRRDGLRARTFSTVAGKNNLGSWFAPREVAERGGLLVGGRGGGRGRQRGTATTRTAAVESLLGPTSKVSGFG